MDQVVALLCVFGLGMCFALLGSISVKLMPRLEIDTGRFGTLISSFMIACMVASLIMGVIVDAIGYKPVAVFGFVVTAIVLLIIARGKAFNMVVGACILLGFGAMALNTAGNTLIPVVLYGGTNEAAASNFGNIFFGLGLFLTPLLVSYLFRKTSYENTITVLAVIILIPVIFALIATYPAQPAGFAIGDAVALLAKPAVLIAALGLFCYIALENSFSAWLPSFGKEVFTAESPDTDEEVMDASAARVLSLFAVAMMIGRLIASQIASITEYGGWFVAGAALIAGVVILGMMRTKSGMQVRALAFVAGLAFGPCFPTVVGVTYSKFSPEIYGSVFGIIFAIGLLGAVLIPKAIGNMAKGSTIQKSLKLLLPMCLILVVLAIVLGVL